jgi:hypothetical protein
MAYGAPVPEGDARPARVPAVSRKAFDPDRHCGGRSRSADGQPCTLGKGHGTDHRGFGHCKFHGGATQNGTVHADRERVVQEVRRLGLIDDVTIDPEIATRELHREILRCVQAIKFAEGKMNELPDDDDLVVGVRYTRTKHTKGGEHGAQTETVQEVAAAPHQWLQLWRAERQQLVRATSVAMTRDLQGRIVASLEQQGALIGDLIDGILADLALTPQQQAAVDDVVTRHLTLIEGRAAG